MRSRISIDLHDAQNLMRGCLDAAAGRRVAVSIAVVDDAGSLILFSRMDEARAHTIDLSTRKARAAAQVGVGTKLIDEALKAGKIGNVESVGWGGVPILVDGKCAGGIGVSGAMPDVDESIAMAGLATLPCTDA